LLVTYFFAYFVIFYEEIRNRLKSRLKIKKKTFAETVVKKKKYFRGFENNALIIHIFLQRDFQTFKP